MSLKPRSLSKDLDRLEAIEKASLRMVCQAVYDFADVAKKQFALAKDLAGTVGEDVLRDAMDYMGMSRVPTARLIGKIDYKRAAYFFHPDYSVRQALLVDAKAEKGEVGNVTIQISQTSMRVRQNRAGAIIDEPGQLDQVLDVDGEDYLATTIFVKYSYEVVAGVNRLNNIYIVGLPNGMLQDRYNIDADDTIWMAGRNAPTLGEDFRVRVSFSRLKDRQNWRVQNIAIRPSISFHWED